MLHLTVLSLLLVAGLANAEVINFQMCAETVNDCTINEVRVDPCPQAKQNAACRIRRNRPSEMSYDITPNFDADTLESTLGWQKSETEYMPLISMERAACERTSCPIKSGVRQTYTVNVPIESKFPLSPYTIRWALRDPVSGKSCCFTHDIVVVR